MRCALYILTLCLLAAVPLRAHAQEAETPGSTAVPQEKPEALPAVLRRTWMLNPTLLAARAELDAVRENAAIAAAGWKPTLSASGAVTHSEIDGSFFPATGTTSREMDLDIRQPLYRGGRTVAQTGGAAATIRARRALLAALGQDVLLQAATAYMDVARDSALLDLATGNEALLAREREATEQRFAVGELTRTDVAQAQARLAGAQAAREKARGALESSRAVFEQLTGSPPSTLSYPEIAFPIPDTAEDTALRAENGNPEIAAATAMEEAATADIGSVFGELLPELSLFANWNRQNDPQPGLVDRTTTKSAGITASIPLYAAGATRARLRQARHTANQRHIQIAEMRRAVRREAIAGRETLRAALADIEARKAQVEAAELAWRGVKEESALGARTVLDVLDADQELQDARAALVAARRDAVVALFALAKTMGLLTPETLGFPNLSTQTDGAPKD